MRGATLVSSDERLRQVIGEFGGHAVAPDQLPLARDPYALASSWGVKSESGATRSPQPRVPSTGICTEAMRCMLSGHDGRRIDALGIQRRGDHVGGLAQAILEARRRPAHFAAALLNGRLAGPALGPGHQESPGLRIEVRHAQAPVEASSTWRGVAMKVPCGRRNAAMRAPHTLSRVHG